MVWLGGVRSCHAIKFRFRFRRRPVLFCFVLFLAKEFMTSCPATSMILYDPLHCCLDAVF